MEELPSNYSNSDVPNNTDTNKDGIVDNEDHSKNKKKRTRYFETYICKALKTISSEHGITANAKQQLNSSICIIAKEIFNRAFTLTSISKKKTMSEKEVANSIRTVIEKNLAENIIKEAENSLEKYLSNDSKHTSRQEKAGILFPPSITEKFLRNFGQSKIMVTKNAPVFLAVFLEKIVLQILKDSTQLTHENNRVRITIRDLELTVRKNDVLNKLFNNCNLSFIGGGVLPQIHESLLNKKPRKKKKNKDEKDNDVKKNHRFRPGTVSLREIRKFQKTSNFLTFAKFPFERYIRSIINNQNDGMKISKDVFIVLQYYVEQFVVDFLKDANMAAIHSGRVKLMPSDITFISDLRKYDKLDVNPYEQENTVQEN